jgi:hypothetical protein
MSEFDKKISALTSGEDSTATDEYVIARGGSNFKISGALVAAAATKVGTLESLAVTGAATAGKLVPTANTVTGNGMYLPTTNVLAFSTNGVEAARIDASGNVGIGATPSYKLHIQGAASSQLVLQSVDTNSTNKEHTIGGRHYTNSEEPLSLIGGFSTSGAGEVYVGGGFSGGNAATKIAFYTGANTTTTTGTERASIPAAGGFQCVNSISVGNATPTTSGAGITFPATQSASSDANTLDDYEEGTFTPVATCTGQTITHTQQSGSYTKIGNLVRATVAIVINTVSGAAGGATTITGLPFSNGGITYSGQGGVGYNDGITNVIGGTWIDGTTVFFRSGTRNQSNDAGGFTAGGYINLELLYRV